MNLTYVDYKPYEGRVLLLTPKKREGANTYYLTLKSILSLNNPQNIEMIFL
jgi:hypothetical protein